MFAVLPWGVRAPENPEPGHATSAPDHPRLWRKAAITSLIAAVLWLIVFYLVQSELIPLRITGG